MYAGICMGVMYVRLKKREREGEERDLISVTCVVILVFASLKYGCMYTNFGGVFKEWEKKTVDRKSLCMWSLLFQLA